jgi:hypothetical protein
MTKFILFMLVCSGIPGNECKNIPTPVTEFDTYHECIYFGYDYSSILLKEMTAATVDEYQMYTRFDCKADKII